MGYFADIVDDIQQHWPVYATMPLIMAAIGWITKLVAVEMMFRPIEFVGKPPIFGWQGVIPRFAPRMASIAMDTLLGRLIKPQEIFDRLDADELYKNLEKPMSDVIDEMARELMLKYQPGLWESLPERLKRLLIKRIQGEAPKMIHRLVDEMKRDLDSVLDVRDMAIRALIRDKALLNRLIREVAQNEMKFIVRSGLYFGFALGFVQAGIWAATHSAIAMPLFAAFVGFATDWLALQMIFLPKEPKKFFGVGWQGLFHARREEVTRDYGNLVANEILTPTNIVEGLINGPQFDRLFALVRREVDQALDAQAGILKPLVVVAVGSQRYQEMKKDVVNAVVEQFPETTAMAQDYAMEAMDVRNTIISKMQLMTSDEYENLLRPAFKQDEWKLIAVGGILGFLVGEAQVHFLLLPLVH